MSKLQYTGTLDGLNLAYPTLGAYLKYPNKGKAGGKYVGDHKHGIFFTEEDLFGKIVKCCNMKKLNEKTKKEEVKRHPLSFLIEAADSICYGIMDMEDGYNINWYSFDDMIRALNMYVYEKAVENNKIDFLKKYAPGKKNAQKFSIENLIGFKRKWSNNTDKDKRRLILDFRVKMIDYLTELAIKNFIRNLEDIDNGKYDNELLKDDNYCVFSALSEFAQRKIIARRDIQELELTGNSVINGLLDILMRYAFSEDKKYRSKIKAVISKSRMEVTIHEHDFKKVKFKTFNENDLWKFDVEQLDNYSKLRLIVDFVASMTDKYSVELYQRFAGMRM